jgi:hypothetical protein
MPNNPPGQPPIAPSSTSVNSETRCLVVPARHLSKPNVRNVTTLMVANQMSTMVSINLTQPVQIRGNCFGSNSKLAATSWRRGSFQFLEFESDDIARKRVLETFRSRKSCHCQTRCLKHPGIGQQMK